MLISFLRVVKFSFQDIFRNIWLSLVTIIIMVLSLFIVNMLIVIQVIGVTATNAVIEKVDISLDLVNGAQESDILALKTRIAGFPETREVVYISAEDALASLKAEYADDATMTEAIREVGRNPISASLTIKSKSLDEYDLLIRRINAVNSDIIASRDFSDYKALIDAINTITKKVSDAGMILGLVFAFITLLVVYNSVRMAIYTHRKQIVIMKLVGASDLFIQMPYLFSSFIYTLVSLIIVMGLFFPFLSLLQPYLEAFFVGYSVDLMEYFYVNAFMVFGGQFAAACLVNLGASLIAVRKYSKV